MADITWPWQYNFPPFFTYINEGNAHIVVQLLDTDYVLRLIKEDEKTVHQKNVYDSVNFVNLIMVPLLENKFYGCEEAIEIPQHDLAELSRIMLPFRPGNRIFKSVLSQIAIKATNLSVLSPKCETNYCIEIKPKEGFISSNLRIYSKCYYCLKQHLKLQTGLIPETSKYCPLDLFSGDKERMKQSLLNMIHNPQNNFKLFKDGTLIFNEKSSLSNLDGIVKNMNYFNDTNLFLDFIVDILFNDKNVSYIKIEKSKKMIVKDLPDQCLESNNLNCNNNSLLSNLLQLQKLSETNTFDLTDVKNKYNDYVSKLIEQLKSENLDLNIQEDRVNFLKTANPIHLALISAVAKDCSIMISFSTNYVENFPYVEVGESKIFYKLALTDLEPKSPATLSKRKAAEKRLIEIYENYIEASLNKEQQCKIQPHTETRAKQLEAWEQLITEYLKTTKQSTIDIRESQNSPLFNNTEINRKLSQEAILTILEDMAKTGRAAPMDKSKNVWEVYWHSLDEWGNLVYNWACNNGMNNSVCTLFELREGENTVDQEFHGLDMSVLLKALKNLELKGRCELMEFDDSQGVKFF